MSNLVTNLCRPLRLRSTPKCVLMALADRADDSGLCWPSFAWLEEWTCFSRRAVIDALQSLEEAGVITLTRSQGRSSQCVIDLQAVAARCASCTPTSAPAAPVQETHPTRAGDALPPVQETHPTRAAGAPNTSETPFKTSVKQKTAGARTDPDSLPEGFLDFWSQYPKKDAKADAIKAWRQMGLDASEAKRAKVMAGLAAWKRHEQWTKDGGRFIPHPATFLRQERWSDESATKPGGSPGRPSAPPDWWKQAGFDTPGDAGNARCYWSNFTEFRDGKRIEVATA